MLKKITSLLLVLGLSAALCTPAFAVQNNSTSSLDKQIELEETKQFFSSKNNVLQKLNEVTKAPIQSVKTSYANGNIIKTEIRNIKISDKLSITNTRTFTIPSNVSTMADLKLEGTSMQTVDNSYGFSYAGVPNALGAITATYSYEYEHWDSPNHVQTHIYNATGGESNLDSNYFVLEYVTPAWDTAPSYNAHASVAFHMKGRPTPALPIWYEYTYTNHCTFDSSGTPSFSWYN